MDSNGNKPSNPVRGSSSWNECKNESHVVEISSDVPSKEPMDSSTAYGYARTANEPPEILRSSIFSKPESRFGEQSYYMDSDMPEEEDSPTLRDQTVWFPSEHKKEDDGEEDRVGFLSSVLKKKVKTKTLMKWVGVVCTIGCLVASLSVHPLKNCYLWGLKLWKWCLLATVTFFGMIITGAVQLVTMALIENYYTHNNEVFYFVYGLKASVRATLWLTLVLVTWLSLFDWSSVRDLRSKTTRKILDAVTWTLITILLGSILWLVKTLSLKILRSKFRKNQFLDKIQETIFHLHVLLNLLTPPQSNGVTESTAGSKRGRLCFMSKKSDQETIDMRPIEQLRLEKVTASKMKQLVQAFKTSQNSILQQINGSNKLIVSDGADVMKVAKIVANKIFKNIVLPGNKFIEKEDLLKVMDKDTVDLMFPQFEVDAETRKIDRRALIDWVAKVYKESKKLLHALNDTKTAVKQLNHLVSVLIIIASAIIWLLLMEVATTKVLLLLLSQIAVASFVFGNSCKTTFEALIFVFIMHPFDVGDYCSVDGITMVVEEMNILTTVFLKLDNEKVYFPNSVLATKSISNYYRSPNMKDTIEFSIAFATPVETIQIMKDRIKSYLEKNPKHWKPNKYSVGVNEIEDLKKLKMILCVNHTMNFQDWGEKSRRRSNLVIEMKTIFEELNISYDLLPQTTHVAPVEDVR